MDPLYIFPCSVAFFISFRYRAGIKLQRGFVKRLFIENLVALCRTVSPFRFRVSGSWTRDPQITVSF